MDRRNFILAAIVGGAAVGTGGWIWIGTDNHSLTIEASIRELDKLMDKPVATVGDWNVAQILAHCAQSVEFSMTGFPEQKSALFRNTVGATAFALFSATGKMTHSLSEAIPGAPLIKENAEIPAAYERFRESMLAFRDYSGRLAPHFAYGSLTKSQYERAHAMHFYNHLVEIRSMS